MKRFFSILALFVVLALAMSLFGCGPGGGGDVDDENNFNGGEIVIVCYWDDVPTEPGNTLSSQRWYQRYKDLEKKYNCIFTCNVLVETEISAQFEAAVLADKILGDIVFFKMEHAKKFQKQNMLYDVSDYMDFTADYLNSDVTRLFSDPKTGAVYAFSNYKTGQRSFLVFNKDIFDRFGVEYPYEYVKNNTWTPEKFLDLATRTTSNSEGIKGFYGIVIDPFISYFINGFGGSICYTDENGYYQSGLSKPETLEGLRFIRDMNVVHKVTYVPQTGVAWDDYIKQFKDGKVAMAMCADFLMDDLSLNMDADYGVVPYPKKPEVAQWANISETHNVRVIQANMPEKRAKALCKVYSEYMMPLASPEEQEDLDRDTFENWCKDQESVDILMELNKIELRAIQHIVASPNVFYGLVYSELEAAMRGEKDVLTVIETVDPIFKEELKATNEGTEYSYEVEGES